jgi:iron complex outermembrane receptor protein
MKSAASILATSGALFAATASLSTAGAQEAGAQTVLREIVVTAQKREQSVQDVAAAVTAVTGQALRNAGVTRLADVQNLVPSIRLQTESASTEIYIRGVGSTLDLPMIESPNAYNINGVFIPREVTSASMFDVDRIEVLPGPQGTLWGRGALGGAVNMITARPGDSLETGLLVEAGDYSLKHVVATQNIPVSDQFRMRVALNYNERDGYLESGANSADDLAGLLSFDWRASDAVSVYLWAHLERKEGYADNLNSKGTNSDPRSQRFQVPSNPWDDRLLGSLASYATLGPVDRESRDWDAVIIGGEINWDINDELTLTYVPSYLDFDWSQGYWITHKPGIFGAEAQQTTHELRLSSDSSGPVDWLVGLYGYRFESAGHFFIQFGPNELFPYPAPLWLNANHVANHVLQGYAAFGQMTWSITDEMRLIAGGRASKDDRKAHGFAQGIVTGDAEPSSDYINLFSLFFPPYTPAPLPTWSGDESWDNIDWKLGLEYDSRPGMLWYATLQTGYQPGTFDSIPGVMALESNLMAVTAGVKASYLDGRLVVNDELFYYDYSDLLTSAWNAALGANVLTNADSRIYGNQLDLSYMPQEHTQVRLAVGYLNARYDDSDLGVFDRGQMQNSPDWTFNLGLRRDFPMGEGFLRAQLDSRYESSYWGNFMHSPGLHQDPYVKSDLSLTYHAANDAWTLGLWVKNLEDTDVQSAAAPGSTVFDPGPGATFLEPPRTYGIRFTMRYAP